MSQTDRFHLDEADLSSSTALSGLTTAVRSAADGAGVPRAVLELLNVRQAQAAGVSAQQLAELPAWRESTLFSDLERAALGIGELVTAMSAREDLLARLQQAREAFTDERYSALQRAAVTMNACNRISILSQHPVRARLAGPDSASFRSDGSSTAHVGAALTEQP
ncbi:carboxymuconolactone decarboxylase family protein [Kineococcus arenarius]|uniref:carboxymuconolactone decarboxylase family protein n=1 Tax=unclassified Kineococcus TaxID=2621656 RepID=UPI003D7DA8FE